MFASKYVLSIKVTEPDFLAVVKLYFITVLYCFFRISELRNFFLLGLTFISIMSKS